MATYAYTDLLAQVADSTVWANVGNNITAKNILNRAARLVVKDKDLRSLKRRAQIAPFIFDDVYEYTCPADMGGLIDVLPQVNRSPVDRMSLRTEEYFDRKKTLEKNMVAIADDDLVSKLKINIDADDMVLEASSLDSISAGGGTWAVYGDAATLTVDETNYVEGVASLKFALTGSGTTAGVDNTTLEDMDITDYIESGSLFVWVYINSITNLTNFVLQIGNDLTTNYYTQTITTNNEGVAFYQGWNLLRFDFASMSLNGTVDPTAVDAIRLYMTKAEAKNDDGYRFDGISLHTGQVYQAVYYSTYPWQTSAGVWIINCTQDTDKLNATSDEFDLFVFKGKEQLFMELKEWDMMKVATEQYEKAKKAYKYKSEKLKLQERYW